MSLYTKSYAQNPDYIDIRGFEIPVPLPRKPKPQEFRNYGLPVEKQKFVREEVPKDVYLWDKIRYDRYVSEQWHKRKNGEWWLIKGREVYITGPAWLFFNHWDMEAGGKPDFRMEAVEWFLVWEYVCRDPNCFGMLDIKCRRLGDTEKSLCAGWEMATRYRKSWFGMQNINDLDAKANFDRIVSANAVMPRWFKPVHRGKETPEKALVFKYPSDTVTAKTVREGKGQQAEFIEDKTPHLGSIIDFKATRLKAYDGKRLRVYHLDEPGKLSPKDMDVSKQWGIIRQCLSLHNELTIVGKGILTTTVEDIANGETVKVCQKLWDGANPADLTAMGRTSNGLWRYHRNYRLAARVDEWGFHKEDEASKVRQAQIDAFLKAGDLDGLSDYLRKVPDTVEESLAVPANQCILYPALLDIQQQRLHEWAIHNQVAAQDHRFRPYPVAQRGDFVWTNGFKSEVRFTPNPVSGKFWVSGHPDMPNHKILDGGLVLPGNRGRFTIGVDGIDHKGAQGSDFSISVFRVWDPNAETDIEWADTEGGREIANKWAMKTNRFVCTYSRRPNNPEEAYEDCLKCAMYYGVPIFAEQQKPGVLRFFERNNMAAYTSRKAAWIKVGSKKSAEAGVHQSPGIAALWTDELKMHVYEHIETYVHSHQIAIFRKYTGDNANECDQVISSGLALLDMRQYLIRQTREEKRREWAMPFETYNNIYN